MPADLSQPQPARALSRHFSSPNRLSTIIWAVAALACLVLSVRLAMAVKYSSEDSWFPMTRALEFMHSSSPGLVYKTLFFSKHIKFQYPPSGLLLLELLRWMSIEGTASYNALNAGALIVTGLVFAIFTHQVLGEVRCFGLRFPIAPIAFIAAIKFFPAHYAFSSGQIQVLLGLCFSFACLALLHEKRVLTGLLIAAAATVKPQFLIFGLLALWRRDWRFLAGFAGLTIAAMIASIALYGWDAQFDYLRILQFLSRHGECYHTNQSINGILNRYLSDVPCVDADPEADPSSPVLSSWFPPYIAAVYFATVLSSVIMIAIPFLLRVRGTDRMSILLGFCTAAILFTMASPIAWIHHYNVLLPAYVVGVKIALDRWQGRRAWGVLLLFGISFVLTAFQLTTTFGPTEPGLHLIQSHVFLGACLLVGLLLAEMLVYPQRESGGEIPQVDPAGITVRP